MAAYAVQHNLPLPDQYHRSTAALLMDEFAGAYLGGQWNPIKPDPSGMVPDETHPAEHLTAVDGITQSMDAPDQARAKLYKATAYAMLGKVQTGEDLQLDDIPRKPWAASRRCWPRLCSWTRKAASKGHGTHRAQAARPGGTSRKDRHGGRYRSAHACACSSTGTGAGHSAAKAACTRQDRSQGQAVTHRAWPRAGSQGCAKASASCNALRPPPTTMAPTSEAP